MSILHLDSSILGPNSVSRKLSADVVARLKAAQPDRAVTYRDLAAAPLSHYSMALIAAGQAGETEHEPALAADLADSNAVLQEFLAADTVVIGVAFYNFTIASQLKAWIDRILIPGQTFRYGAEGRPEGLAGDKRVILTIARGGLYGPGSPSQMAEHAESYLRATFAFMGVVSPEVIVAEGLRIGPEHHQAAVTKAEQAIAALAA